MTYFKKTFIWVIVLVGLAGYSFLDLEHTRVQEEKKEEATRLLPFYPIDVLSILIEKEDGMLELERWDKGWKIVAPIKAKAEDKAVEDFLFHVTESRNDADYVMDLDPSPERLAEFGLDNPTLFVTLKVGTDLTPHTIVFGNRAPTMGVAFAQLKGQKPIYRVLADARAEADKDAYYFRDKSVLRYEVVMFDQLLIKRADPAGDIRVELPDTGKWELAKPIIAPADHFKVFEMMGAFKNAEVKEFIDETKDDLAQYGLDKPSTELVFWMAGDSEPIVTIQIGNRSPEKRGYFATMSDRDNVFLLEESVVNAVPAHVNEFRSRELFQFDKDKIKRIEIRMENNSVVLVRDADREWRKGRDDGEKIDFNKINEFLVDLTDSRIEDFVTSDVSDLGKYGLDPVRVQLLLWPEGSAVPISLSVGKKTPTGDQIYALGGKQSEVLALSERMGRILKTYFF